MYTSFPLFEIILFDLHLSMSSKYTPVNILDMRLFNCPDNYKPDLENFSFSLKINKLTAFSEITQAWQCLKIVFIWSDEFTY